MLDADSGSVLRFLESMGKHPGKKQPTDVLIESIDYYLSEMKKQAKPKYIYRGYPLHIDGDCMEFAGITVKSRVLSKNLSGCDEIYMMAATLGTDVDRIIQRAQVTGASASIICQACGAALAENLAETVNNKIKEELKLKGRSTKPRFSPGFGDFPLDYQRDFVRILDLNKSAGIYLTDTYLMRPSKSVTAVVGTYSE